MSTALIHRAAELLRRGGVVAFPTETVYGLGADALNPPAVARIFEIKARPRFDPLIVHVADAEHGFDLAVSVPSTARALAARFWPGPLTLVLARKPIVPDIVTAGLPTVAIRVPAHRMAIELIAAAGSPLAAPSANRFGRVSPTCAQHVHDDLGDDVDLVLDGGPCATGVESTVLSLADPQAVLLRPGGTPVEEIESIIGPVYVPGRDPARPQSPGQLSQHYAPRTAVALAPVDAASRAGLRVGLLAFDGPTNRAGYVAVEVLSERGDLREVAANLFAALRRLDACELDLIVAERAPERGLGRAINDRLRRAASGSPRP